MGNGNAIILAKSGLGADELPDDPDSQSSQILVRKLATILSADVAEFSRLMGEDEEQTLKTFRGHEKVFAALVATHRGRIFNTAGDAILAEFASAVEAVRCATDIQAALRTRNDQLPPSRQVRFRIGINLGDVMEQGQDLMGDGVNVAARLQTAAEPGGICLSGSVYDQIRNKLSLSFVSLGEMNFKNIQQPVRTFSITESEDRLPLPTPKPRTAGSGSAKWIAAGVVILAVPLAGGGYWIRTGHERGEAESPRAIAATPQPEVTPPTATPAAAASSAPPSRDAEAAYDDGMRLMDEDKATESVLRFDAAIRAKPDFIDAYVERAEARRRLDQYELSLEDCNKIIALKPDEPRGYNCRGLGRQLLKQYHASLPDFSEAIRLNPNFALAYGNRGTTYNLLQWHDHAIRDFNEAIRLMPSNSQFHLKRGNSYSNLKQYHKAIRDYTEAIRLNPDNISAYRLRAQAEDASGDATGAAADRAHMQESENKNIK
jgi:class 3 adenylate cyclase/Tfp pilus assembly protein PilF